MTDFVTGDTGSTLRVTCRRKDALTIIDLSGATVVLSWKDKDGNTVSKNMTLSDAVNGIAIYKFLATELVDPWMSFEVQITDPGGFILSNLVPIEVKVRAEFA